MEKILAGEKLGLSEHLRVDDNDMLFSIKQWQYSEDAILADLAKRFLHRRLFKAFDLDMPEGQRQGFVDASRRIVSDAGFEAEYYFVEDEAGNAVLFLLERDR